MSKIVNLVLLQGKSRLILQRTLEHGEVILLSYFRKPKNCMTLNYISLKIFRQANI